MQQCLTDTVKCRAFPYDVREVGVLGPTVVAARARAEPCLDHVLFVPRGSLLHHFDHPLLVGRQCCKRDVGGPLVDALQIVAGSTLVNARHGSCVDCHAGGERSEFSKGTFKYVYAWPTKIVLAESFA